LSKRVGPCEPWPPGADTGTGMFVNFAVMVMVGELWRGGGGDERWDVDAMVGLAASTGDSRLIDCLP